MDLDFLLSALTAKDTKQAYGTLLELDYNIVMKNNKQEKLMLDELRTRNGNLNISLVQTAVEEQ